MKVRTREFLTMAAMSALTLVAVLANGAGAAVEGIPPQSAVESHTTVVKRPGFDVCSLSAKLPTYDVRYEDGSVVHVTSGAVLVREASMDGANGRALRLACRAFLSQYLSDTRP